MIRSPLNQLQEMAPSKRTIRGHLRRVERSSLRHAHKFIVQRLANLRDVRRHAAGWLVLIGSLVGVAMWQQSITMPSYTERIPAEGRVFSEGAFGSLDNLNPILASSAAERSGARLLFAQLLAYDSKGDLVGELAQSWRAEDGGKSFVVELRPSAVWQDGQKITADDVVFTFNMIKNADAHSPLYSSWRNVVVEKINDVAVRFMLPAPYAAFPSSLTVGILPMHALKDVQPSELRTASFNLRPTVTSGSFVFQDTNVIKPGHILLRLKANNKYVLGAPKLDGFHLHAYKDRDEMVKAYRSQEVASISDVDTDQLRALGNSTGYAVQRNPLYNGTYAFFKTDGTLLNDAKVRQALQYAFDQPALLKRLDNRVGELTGPLLSGQLGYRDDIRQPARDVNKANALLDAAGWVRGPDGRRIKNGQVLQLRLVSISSGDFPLTAEELINEWQQIGVTFDSQLVRPEDIQQNVIAPRGYDVLVYEIAIGRDPDVYAYWHSSQATERGFNLSDYKSSKVDEQLDSARSRLDPTLRDAKYSLFFQQWVNDAPAVALYRPTLNYVQNKNVVTFNTKPLVDQSDRYFNIRSWAAGTELGHPTR